MSAIVAEVAATGTEAHSELIPSGELVIYVCGESDVDYDTKVEIRIATEKDKEMWGDGWGVEEGEKITILGVDHRCIYTDEHPCKISVCAAKLKELEEAAEDIFDISRHLDFERGELISEVGKYGFDAAACGEALEEK